MPTAIHCRKADRNAREPGRYEARALEASTVIRNDFSWQIAAEKCISILNDRYGLFEFSVEL